MNVKRLAMTSSAAALALALSSGTAAAQGGPPPVGDCWGCGENPFPGQSGEVCEGRLSGAEACRQDWLVEDQSTLCDLYGDVCSSAARYVMASGRLAVHARWREPLPDGTVRRSCDQGIVRRDYSEDDVKEALQRLHSIQLSAT
jgi:hypothetical protein